jgi:hypothetical protein
MYSFFGLYDDPFYKVRLADMCFKVLLLICCTIMSFAILTRIVKQIKHQAEQHQMHQLKNNLRVAIAILFQNIVLLFLTLMEAASGADDYFCSVVAAQTETFCMTSSGIAAILYIFHHYWLEISFQFFVLFNSIVTLFVLTGYRQAMFNPIKLVYKKVRGKGTATITNVQSMNGRSSRIQNLSNQK